MKSCQRNKIDGNPCRGGTLNNAYFKGFHICNACYLELTNKQKKLNRLNILYEKSYLKCKKCGKVMPMTGQHNTGYCKECLKDPLLFSQILKEVRKFYK